uniref:Fucosyltransferase n=1 Tax=Gongylonema pulchrum TaxID=637853 RepID=A0A183DDX5_9BILA
LAFENSVCRDYITEKLWKHGYQHNVVPIVLKRSIVEQYVPPHSFIAVDDFETVGQLASYLEYLMRNTSAYREYFEWRREYKVIFLDGRNHDELERPWGFCQLCRLLWMEPRPQFTLKNFDDFWNKTCESRGALVTKILRHEKNWKNFSNEAVNNSSEFQAH